MGTNYIPESISAGLDTTSTLNTNMTNIQTSLSRMLNTYGDATLGSNSMQVDLDMNSNRAINASDGVSNSDYTTLRQLQSLITSSSVQDVTNASVVNTTINLTALTVSGLDNLHIAFTKGYSTAGDGGEGTYYYDSASSATANGGTVFAPDVGSGRWLLISNGIVNIKQFGAIGNGTTDNITAVTNAFATGNAVYAPSGTYYLSTALSSSTSEPDTFTFYGDGASSTTFLFDSTSGFSLAGTGMKMRDMSIVDRASFSSVPTDHPETTPSRVLITASTVGLDVTANNCVAENVLIIGFATGKRHTGAKFYQTNTNVRCQHNLIGNLVDTNFTRSYGCYYSSNFQMNEHITSGQHDAHDTSYEVCADESNSNVNFPNGGIYIHPRGEGIYDHCWMENQNFFNYSKKTRIVNPANLIRSVLGAPITVTDSKFGVASKNLALPPWLSKWETNGISAVSANTQIQDDKRYSILTSSGGVGAHDTQSHLNYDVRGWQPPLTEGGGRATPQYYVMSGAWVHIKSNNFSSTYPRLRARIEDTSGSFYNVENHDRSTAYDATQGFNSDAIGGTGTASSTSTFELVDSGAAFLTTVSIGALVRNTTTGANAIVSSIDSNTTITINDDIFTSGNAYSIECWQYIGVLTQVRSTFTTANPVASIRLQLELGDSAEDHSGANRVLWMANPSLQIFADTSHPVSSTHSNQYFSTGNTSNPPTDAELDSLFGTPAELGQGFSVLLDDAGGNANAYRVHSNGTSWWYDALTKAT